MLGLLVVMFVGAMGLGINPTEVLHALQLCGAGAQKKRGPSIVRTNTLCRTAGWLISA